MTTTSTPFFNRLRVANNFARWIVDPRRSLEHRAQLCRLIRNAYPELRGLVKVLVWGHMTINESKTYENR